MTMTEIQNLLIGLMRGIDKKTSVSVEQWPNAERPKLTVRLTRDKRAATVEIAESDLLSSANDLRSRNRLRTTLKRARDRMWEETGYIFSTKVEHQMPEGMQMFRPSQGFRGRR